MLIEEQTNQLKMMDLAKSRFFANVSHELRTPLTLLLGPVHTLLHENQLTDRQVNLLHIAQRNGKQLGQLVNDILDLGKLELGKMNVDAVPTFFVPFFRSHLAQFVSLAESMEIRYHFEVTSASEVIVLLDQVKCQQIVNNLLNNAFKFTSAGGEITVMVNLNNTQLHLHVTDNGDGIHPDDQPYLFDCYFQATRPEKPAYGGTGIGLALCQEYVQLWLEQSIRAKGG
jgi:signal transduction histidine kinase